jgi:uncharacterized protein YsxB (DUF464 family)
MDEYDQQTTLKLTGTIEEAGYEHPHGHIKLKTADKDVECGARAAVSDGCIAAFEGNAQGGATATVEGYPSRVKPEEMRAERITVAGKTVELR